MTPNRREAKRAAWLTTGQLAKLAERTKLYQAGTISETEWQKSPGLEPVWCEWFRELKII